MQKLVATKILEYRTYSLNPCDVYIVFTDYELVLMCDVNIVFTDYELVFTKI